MTQEIHFVLSRALLALAEARRYGAGNWGDLEERIVALLQEIENG